MADEDYKKKDDEEVLDINETVDSKDLLFYHKLRKRDKKIKNSESYNNYTILYVVSLVALFVIWFTAFAQPLAYNNRLLLFNNKKDNNYSNNEKDKSQNNNDNTKTNTNNTPAERNSGVRKSSNFMWDVGFVNMDLSSKVGQAVEVISPSFTKTRANFHVSLVEPGDEISYNIDIKNSGTIDAKVSDIIINPITEIDDPILFVFSGIEVGDELDAGKTTTVSVNVKYNPNYTGPKDKLSQDFVVYINYVQK
ncbi:MAG: hypothetical protein IKF91_04020 [Bacilli bacterium]|nr:hypothetical protein [Bacilli bacterium]